MVEFRVARKKDKDFLYELKKLTMRGYVEQIWGWDENDQRIRFQQNFLPNRIKIIVEKNRDIGMIQVEEQEKQSFIHNIHILPEFQNKGIGSFLIKEYISQSFLNRKELKLQVLKLNRRAFNFYIKLGFKIISKTETHFQLKYIQ